LADLAPFNMGGLPIKIFEKINISTLHAKT
jgi:hypothetical protein